MSKWKPFLYSVKDMVGMHKIDLVALLETRTSGENANEIIKKIRMSQNIRVEANDFVRGI